MDENDRIVRWLEWVYVQGYELINRDLLEEINPSLNGLIHSWCLDDFAVLEEVDAWRVEQGEPSLFGPDDAQITPSA